MPKTNSFNRDKSKENFVKRENGGVNTLNSLNSLSLGTSQNSRVILNESKGLCKSYIYYIVSKLNNLSLNTKNINNQSNYQRVKTPKDKEIYYPYSLYNKEGSRESPSENLTFKRELSISSNKEKEHINTISRQISARQIGKENNTTGYNPNQIANTNHNHANNSSGSYIEKTISNPISSKENKILSYSRDSGWSNNLEKNNSSLSTTHNINSNNYTYHQTPAYLQNDKNPTKSSFSVSGYNLNINSSITTTNNNPSNLFSSLCNKKIGLDNLGNTCFMNTGLQCLLHTEPFMRRFYIEKQNFPSSSTTSQALYDLCKEMVEKTENSRSSIAPYTFKRVFGSKHEMFSGYSQHDTQEFLRILLDDVSQEMNRVKVIPKYRELDAKIKDKVRLNTEYDKLYKERENSIVIDTFTVQLLNIFTCCECGYETYSFDKLIDIPLLLESDSYSGFSIFSLLNAFFTTEKIKWESPCENSSCKKKSYHTKIVKLSICPEILIFSIQRNNGRARRKNTSAVTFEETVDVSKFFDVECLGKTC